jgi:hypothetical protein
MELEQRGHLQPRGTGPAARKAANYDINKHAAPSTPTIALERTEPESEQGAPTSRAQHNQDSDDEQENYDKARGRG